MMKKWMFTCLLSQALAASVGIAAYGAQWHMDHMGWWYDNGDGTWPAGQWQWLDGNGDGIAECYYFDHNGYCMVNGVTPDGYQVNGDGAWTKDGVVQTQNTGGPGHAGMWKQSGGKWFFEDASGNRKINGWHWLDGNQDGISECYYFDSQGWLLTGTTTPDGYQVNTDGAWTEGGIVKTKGAGGNVGTGTASGGRSSSGGGGSSGGNSVSTSSGKKTSREHYWDDYEDYSVYHAANDFTEGNYGQMTESQIDAVERRIKEFKREHIKSGMSDFEKEMEIVRWIVENCEYRSTGGPYDWVDATAYSCIINGKACCSGYADAFLQMAKACGLSARYIHNSSHAWNLVKLDGDWYHVDVTWEDQGDTWSAPSLYTNLTDSIIRDDSSHANWTPSSVRANGTRYGSTAVDLFLEYGDVSYSGGADLKRLEAASEGNVIQHRDIDQTIQDIQDYMDNQIQQRRETYEYVVKTDFEYGDSRSQTDIHNLNAMLLTKGYGNLRSKYNDILEDMENQITHKDLTQDHCYYIYKKGKITYKKEYSYVIRFMENGIEVSREKGRCPIDKSLFVKCPDGYVYACMADGNNDYVILEGDGSFDGGWLKIYEGPTLELEVRVEEKDYEEAEEWEEETAEHVVIHDRIVLELEREDKGQQEENREEEIESEADKDDGEDLDMTDEEEDEEIEEKENTEDRTKKEHEQNVDLNESTKDMNKNTEEENINTMEEDI
ncbi:MAG: hypothetical protein HFG62_08090 [Lachnospiraceae bacterium]|jgi:hypothetical protein|nr:hypothetical protein [Lachnospiraceae bacterium]